MRPKRFLSMGNTKWGPVGRPAGEYQEEVILAPSSIRTNQARHRANPKRLILKCEARLKP